MTPLALDLHYEPGPGPLDSGLLFLLGLLLVAIGERERAIGFWLLQPCLTIPMKGETR